MLASRCSTFLVQNTLYFLRSSLRFLINHFQIQTFSVEAKISDSVLPTYCNVCVSSYLVTSVKLRHVFDKKKRQSIHLIYKFSLVQFSRLRGILTIRTITSATTSQHWGKPESDNIYLKFHLKYPCMTNLRF